MGETMSDRYWCHMCAQIVNPIMELEIKCPFCDSGFVEEMNSAGGDGGLGGIVDEDVHDGFVEEMNSAGGEGEIWGIVDEDDDDELSDRSLSQLAPFLRGMMGGRSWRRRSRFPRVDEDSNSDQDRDLEVLRRRRRQSSAILQVLQDLQDQERERESVILINPFNQAIIQGTFDSDNAEGHDSYHGSVGASFGDYFIGPGLDMLLQHLAENEPNRYGTPPAKKEAIDAMPTVKIDENLNCSVCLDDFMIGTEAREMPCEHKFHSDCILPWLELHSSCPVCRLQIPGDESKVSNESSRGIRADGGSADGW